jgi:hypothetical protein
MKKLDFNPAKSKDDFRKNYKLHDLAEYHGKNLLTQWGIEFIDFGNDRRYEKVWEKGKDKPDVIVEVNEQKFLVDWKGKSKEAFWVNKRAIDSYINWSKKLNMQMFVCFFLFDKNHHLKDRRFVLLSKHKFEVVNNKAWDKNEVVKFDDDLPKFTKANLTELINSSNQL